MLGFLNLDGALEVYNLRFGELPLSAVERGDQEETEQGRQWCT